MIFIWMAFATNSPIVDILYVWVCGPFRRKFVITIRPLKSINLVMTSSRINFIEINLEYWPNVIKLLGLDDADDVNTLFIKAVLVIVRIKISWERWARMDFMCIVRKEIYKHM